MQRLQKDFNVPLKDYPGLPVRNYHLSSVFSVVEPSKIIFRI